MNPEQQRIAIAEACGWRHTPSEANPNFWYNEKYKTNSPWITYSARNEDGLPDYLNDLNVMHEAEKVLDDSQLIAMDEYLSRIFKPKPGFKLLWQATAVQRAEAFLRALGKWVEK
jgi:hypothetical protein